MVAITIVSMGSGFLLSWFELESKSGAEQSRSGVSVDRVEELMWDCPWATRTATNTTREGARARFASLACQAFGSDRAMMTWPLFKSEHYGVAFHVSLPASNPHPYI